jgi:hypothetical protein
MRLSLKDFLLQCPLRHRQRGNGEGLGFRDSPYSTHGVIKILKRLEFSKSNSENSEIRNVFQPTDPVTNDDDCIGIGLGFRLLVD